MREILILRNEAATHARVEVPQRSGTIPKGYVGRVINPGESYWGRCYEEWSKHIGHTILLAPYPPPVLPTEAVDTENTWRNRFFLAFWPVYFVVSITGGILFEDRLEHLMEAGTVALFGLAYAVMSRRDPAVSEKGRRTDRAVAAIYMVLGAAMSVRVLALPDLTKWWIALGISLSALGFGFIYVRLAKGSDRFTPGGTLADGSSSAAGEPVAAPDAPRR